MLASFGRLAPPALALGVASALALPLALSGCGPNVPAFPRYGLDAGIECGEARACPSGEVCVQGRCYDECTTSTGCGPGESCVEGVCRGFAGDAGRDAGRDAPAADAPPDLCARAGCAAPTPYCIAGTCVQCETSLADCGGLTPICDPARGACVAPDTSNPVCAPCNNDFDCLGAGSCTTLTGSGFEERVCLPPSAPGCPPGMTTTGAPAGTCVPSLGMTCRNYYAARRFSGCTVAADCAPLGAAPGIDYDPNICPSGVCLFPCGVGDDCPPGIGVCDASGFCSP